MAIKPLEIITIKMQTPSPEILAKNIIYFCNILRSRGVPIGIDRSLDVIKSLSLDSFKNSNHFYWTLASILIYRAEHMKVFEKVFEEFWYQPNHPLTPKKKEEPKKSPNKESRKNDDLLSYADTPLPENTTPVTKNQPSKTPLLSSKIESLTKKDFNSMSPNEIAMARELITKIKFPLKPQPTRRWKISPSGKKLDLKQTIQKSLKNSGQLVNWRYKSRRLLYPSLVLLCDVSGSMKNYSRVLLHFLHVITHQIPDVSSFLFGTQLTNITPQLRKKEINLALQGISSLNIDWGTGTRIGFALKEFNLQWSRRLLTRNAMVILITDGLDSDAGQHLDNVMKRLKKSCKKLVWLNPLLRYANFKPITTGASTIILYTDLLLPIHNLESLQDLTKALDHITL